MPRNEVNPKKRQHADYVGGTGYLQNFVEGFQKCSIPLPGLLDATDLLTETKDFYHFNIRPVHGKYACSN